MPDQTIDGGAQPAAESAHGAPAPAHESPSASATDAVRDLTVPEQLTCIRALEREATIGPHDPCADALIEAVGRLRVVAELQQRELEALRRPTPVRFETLATPAQEAALATCPFRCSRCNVGLSYGATLVVDGVARCIACLQHELLSLRAECQVKSELIAKLTGAAGHDDNASSPPASPAAINATPAMDARAVSSVASDATPDRLNDLDRAFDAHRDSESARSAFAAFTTAATALRRLAGHLDYPSTWPATEVFEMYEELLRLGANRIFAVCSKDKEDSDV